MIVITYTACDGFRDRRTFKTLKGAQKYAHDRIGAHPDIGTAYAVSHDGVAILRVKGDATLATLFPGEHPLDTEFRNQREEEIALYGDGKVMTYAGYDESRHGERIYNSKEDDAAREAQNAIDDAAWRKAMSPEDDEGFDCF